MKYRIFVVPRSHSSFPYEIPIKRPKIYCQHNYDHPYAKNIINDLNDDCLIEIFKYVPAYERLKIALVCKKWNNALYHSWYNVKKLTFTRWSYDYLDKVKMKKSRLFTYGSRYLGSLLNVCGHYLTEIDVGNYPVTSIIKIIDKTCFNLVKLRLRIAIDTGFDDPFIHLSKLKILQIIFQLFSDIPDIVLNSLINVAGTLNELSLANWTDRRYDCEIQNSFVTVLCELDVLKKIELFGFKISPLLGAVLKCSTFKVYIYDRIFFHNSEVSLDTSFNKIEKLDLSNYDITDDFLYNLANTTMQLVELTGRCTLLTDTGIKAITKMKKLKHLRLLAKNNNDYITDTPIKFLKNMKSLFLPYSTKITNDTVIKIMENSPDLTNLSVIHTGVTPELIKKLVEISKNRKEVLNIQVNFDSNIFDSPEYISKYIEITYFDKLIMKKKQEEEEKRKVIHL